MNERIRLLAEQAGIAVWGDAVYMYDPKDTLDSTVMAKFAELIVAHTVECVRDVLRDEESELTYGAAGQVQKRIKQHFGVEEDITTDEIKLTTDPERIRQANYLLNGGR